MFQKVFIINNYFGKNRARYYDIVYVNRMTTNFTRNIFYNNTGTHIVDLTGYPRVRTEYQTFKNNYLYNNIALGHGYQYSQRYGYLPDINRYRRRSKLYELDKTLKRLKRQTVGYFIILYQDNRPKI